MHKSVRERLEEYLRGAGEEGRLAEFRAHMGSCEECREEVGAMEANAHLLRVLRADEEIEPRPGFYAYVMEQIDARRDATIRHALLDPAFGRRLIFASLATVVVLGSYLFYVEQGPVFEASSPVTIMAAEPPDHTQLGADPQRDREEVLLTLASYEEY
jgi:anti-sigma factor RsiW